MGSSFGRLLAWAIVSLWAAAAVPGRACSVVGDYVRPSNFELVQIADAIVVATPEARAGKDPEAGLVFRVEKRIKGAPPPRLEIGMAALGQPGPSDLADLSRSHPEGYAGPCNRMSFARGGHYLLFLEREPDGRWRQLGYPFARINEDYAGEDNAWMRSVRRYLRLQQSLKPLEQIAALRRMIETGRDPAGVALSAAERADIVDHLSSISQWKPTAYLLDLYGRIEQREPLPYAARPDAANREGGEADRVASLLLDEPGPAGPKAGERERLMVLRALAKGDHPEALALFERLAAAPGTDARTRGLVLRYLARNGQYDRAYQWIETRLMAELPRLPEDEAQALIREIGEVQRGESYDEGRERWRSDAHAAATWPELALALYWYQVRTFGKDYAAVFRDALDAIAVIDYRARPELTLALAADFDTKARDWARAELAHPPPPTSDALADPLDYPDLLPLRALVSAWSADDKPVLLRAFCQGGDRRLLVLLALGQWGDGLYGDVLETMAGAPDLSDEDRSALFRATIEMTARDIGESGRTNFLPDDEEKWLVTRLAHREVPSVPLACPAPK
jgi:hypothetical protein